MEITQETGKVQLKKEKKMRPFREESGDRRILFVTGNKDQRVKTFKELGRGLQLGQIIGCTGPYGNMNLNNDACLWEVVFDF